MKKIGLSGIFLLLITSLQAQLEVSHLLPHKGRNYGLGYGCFLKSSYPISDGDDISLEVGIKFNFESGTDLQDGIAVCPLKLGYRYTFDRDGTGLYVEPQLGYNIYGVESYYDDNTYETVNLTFHGIIAGGGAGFLFQPDRHGFQYDIGLYLESVFYQQTSVTAVALRFTYNFNLKRRE
jgi:hypothetical protein